VLAIVAANLNVLKVYYYLILLVPEMISYVSKLYTLTHLLILFYVANVDCLFHRNALIMQQKLFHNNNFGIERLFCWF